MNTSTDTSTPTTRLGRPSWISAEQHERLGPWKPIRKADDRRVVGIVVQGYRKPVAMVEHGQHWRTRDAVRARIALERIDGFALLAVDKYAGDTLAGRLKAERGIRWICCLVRGDLARPIPGAWAKTATKALELAPDRWWL